MSSTIPSKQTGTPSWVSHRNKPNTPQQRFFNTFIKSEWTLTPPRWRFRPEPHCPSRRISFPSAPARLASCRCRSGTLRSRATGRTTCAPSSTSLSYGWGGGRRTTQLLATTLCLRDLRGKSDLPLVAWPPSGHCASPNPP